MGTQNKDEIYCLVGEIVLKSWQESLYNNTNNINKIMPKKTFTYFLGATFHIPKPLREIIIKAMEKTNMIQKVGTSNIQIMPLKKELMYNTNKFYTKIIL